MILFYHCVLSKVIELPFIRYYDDNFLNEQGTLFSKFTNFIGVSFNVGKPAQHLIFNIEFYSDSFWVIDSESTNLGDFQASFRRDKSDTAVNTDPKICYSLTNLKHSSFINMYKDDFKLDNNVMISDLNFFLAKNLTNVPINSGIIGFDINNAKFGLIPSGFNFLDQLRKKDLISHKIFTFEYNSQNYGSVLIGDYPHLHQSDKYLNNGKVYLSTKVAKNDKGFDLWAINFDKVQYIQNEPLFNLNNQKVQFIAELGVIILPKMLEKNVIGTKRVQRLIQEKKCEYDYAKSHVNYKMLKCHGDYDFTEDFGSLVFSLGKYEIELNSTDLLSNHFQNTKVLQIAFYYGNVTKKENEFLVGEPFFRKLPIVFDEEENRIGFYLSVPVKKGNSMLSFFKVIGSIFFILIVIFCCTFIWKKIQLRKGSNLTNKSLDFSKFEHFSIKNEN